MWPRRCDPLTHEPLDLDLNGSKAKYWFRSHHMAKDKGGTWFLLDGGDPVFMEGYFCCGVEIPDPSLTSSAALKDFIAKNDGVHP